MLTNVMMSGAHTSPPLLQLPTLGSASYPERTVQVLKSGDVATWTCTPFPLVANAYHVPLTRMNDGSGKLALMTGPVTERFDIGDDRA